MTWMFGDKVPANVCIRHGRFLPCKPFANDPDCLNTTHPSMVTMVANYQQDTDSRHWDFEHAVKCWIYLIKGQGAE